MEGEGETENVEQTTEQEAECETERLARLKIREF